ncbi:MAG: peptidoglycan-binding domain-containing protein, partial [bacterium]|nr:peptidoglycan-binding domain-containing protein [bacterium]
MRYLFFGVALAVLFLLSAGPAVNAQTCSTTKPSCKANEVLVAVPVGTECPTGGFRCVFSGTGNTNPLALTIGSTGSRVSELQLFLKEIGDFTYPEITGYFGSITQEAVKRYQCRLNIVCSGTPSSTGYGLMGPKTRVAVAERRGLSSTIATQQQA